VALIHQVLAADTSRDRVLERESASDPGALLPDTVAYETVLASWPERPLSPGAYDVEIELRRGRTPERDLVGLAPGEVRQMMVLVRNRGDSTLLRESRNRVALSTRFFALDAEGNRGVLVREGARFAFPADLHPGQETLLPFEVRAPEMPGEYLLVVDLVEEMVRWFESGLSLIVRVGTGPSRDVATATSPEVGGGTDRPRVVSTSSSTQPGADTARRTISGPRFDQPAAIRIQSVLYSPTPVRHERYFAALRQMVRATTQARPDLLVELALGDNSPAALYSPGDVDQLRTSFDGTGLRDMSYRHFDENLGHGGAHNALYRERGSTDFLLVLNPDTCPAPRLLIELLSSMTDTVGIVEGRQLPLEHQKAYDPVTGDTGWASGACALVRDEVLEATGGYDDESFFLYCDDVDFSWRARLAGYRVVYQPRATCFHDKRLAVDAREQPSDTEVFHSGLAGLLLAAKYSRPDLVESQLQHFVHSALPLHATIVEAFTQRSSEGRLAAPLDAEGRVADFSTYAYSPLRFDYAR
jgi:GT2 family glycosyltransferase